MLNKVKLTRVFIPCIYYPYNRSDIVCTDCNFSKELHPAIRQFDEFVEKRKKGGLTPSEEH